MGQEHTFKVFQIKVTLEGIEPKVWRRIEVPEDYTFWDLHISIQDAMGWFDEHLHLFEVVDPASGVKLAIGLPYVDDDWNREILPGWNEKIADYFSGVNTRGRYFYDYFTDNWVHTVELEKTLDSEEMTRYPVCVDGERACPPEDCGGARGYLELLEVIMDPQHRRYQETVAWLGGEFRPDYFEVEGVAFDDPKRRLKAALT